MQATYQTRISVYGGTDRASGDVALAACAKLYGRVQRKLFAEVSTGRSAASLKAAYLERLLEWRCVDLDFQPFYNLHIGLVNRRIQHHAIPAKAAAVWRPAI